MGDDEGDGTTPSKIEEGDEKWPRHGAHLAKEAGAAAAAEATGSARAEEEALAAEVARMAAVVEDEGTMGNNDFRGNKAAENSQASLADGQGSSARAGATGSHRAESWRSMADRMWQWCTEHRAVAAWCVMAVLFDFSLL